MSILTVHTKQNPFPYAAAGIAAFSGTAEIVFDDAATATSLTSGGTTLDDEEAIVQALAKESGLTDDSAKVLHTTCCANQPYTM